jgi:hypothetical protein
MRAIVRTGEPNVISLPVDLMNVLGLQDGDVVAAVVEDQALRLARVGRFLELRGILAGDEEFDRAMEWMEKAWRSWTVTPSV